MFDASVSVLGGCPFAPGATGNVATEDLIYMFNGMDIKSGVDLDSLIGTSTAVSAIDGAKTSGRVREAFATRICKASA